MANVINGNTFYVDTASSSSTAGSFIAEKDVQILAIYFSGKLAADSMTINDVKLYNDAGTPAAGSAKLKVKNAVAEDSEFLRLAESPMRFPNGVWISAISANCTATIIFKLKS